MTTIAVVAHAKKTFGGGLGELREVLEERGFPNPLWYEVAKSKLIPEGARRALDDGADLVLVWGGDGSVQRAIDTLVGSDVVLGILPAGTANLLATNLGIPQDVRSAVEIALDGERRALDTVRMNGEHFAVMAGAGLDALMLRDADAGLKDRIGRAAYIWTGSRHLDEDPVKATVKVDKLPVYKGKITCLLLGNVDQVFGGVSVFSGSRPDDGMVEVGIVTARSRAQWVRTIGRVIAGRAEDSPFVMTTRGARIRVTFDRPMAYELDGGARGEVAKLKIDVQPSSITVAIPSAATAGEQKLRDQAAGETEPGKQMAAEATS
ncbi:MAG TPA: diacylglycerol kinase family protein [Candidatus Nanopelagicales bacterium]|nr:diacylglycerol kinase family protein [Candidatus Nanopelagicales bacterium]